jgi:hypothetical protein
MEVRTYENTNFATWWRLAIEAFAVRGMKPPTYSETSGAYEMGESPETWAEYVRYQTPKET